jgi:pantoate--beta-alanine ligase
MNLIKSVADLEQYILALKAENKTIGFVPTMGALHEGHLQLVRRAVAENDLAIVSVFVNPTQFNDKNDLSKYPRTLEADAALLESVGCMVVFAPEANEFYTEEEMNTTFQFDFAGLDEVMEGKFRPGHFNGVAQVVSRLFAIVEPTKAYFGEKDFQQIAVIRAMCAQLGLTLEIVDCPIIRDVDGLARSSRNTLLTPEHRAAAPHIYQVLSAATEKLAEMTPQQLTEWVVEQVESNTLLKVIYFQAVDALSLQQVAAWSDSERIQGCIAVQAGEIRLIDNIKLK